MISIQRPQRRYQHTIQNRKISWSEWGPATGTPLLFCTGAGMSGSLGFGFSSLELLQLRLIAIDRPGLGESDPDLGKTLSTWGRDIEELIRVMDWRNTLAIGFSQGAVFAYALAASHLVKAVAIVSGQDDFAQAHTQSLLPDQVRGFVQAIRSRDPVFLEGFIATADADGLMKLVLSMSSEKDQSIYASEPFVTAYRQSLREGFAQGAAGYVDDLMNSMGDWPFRIEDLRVPIDLWYGGLDASAVHSPDFGLRLSKRIPGARRFFLSDEGGSLLWTQSESILKALIERAQG